MQKQPLLLFALAVLCVRVAAQEKAFELTGVIRAKYEYNTQLDASRFQVRNARLYFTGATSPVFSYKAEIDLSDEGQIKMLNAYIDLNANESLALRLGQMKVPFSTDYLRSPYAQHFANRSFISKQMTSGMRDVGAQLRWKGSIGLPASAEIAIFNGEGLYNQSVWETEMNYSARMAMDLPAGFSWSANYYSALPNTAGFRFNYVDLGLQYEVGRFLIEAEYLLKQYEPDSIADTKGFLVTALYTQPLPERCFFTSITPLLRYDGMGGNVRYNLAEDAARNRWSAGVNLNIKPWSSYVRLNYEKYVYKNAALNQDDKWVLEFVAHF